MRNGDPYHPAQDPGIKKTGDRSLRLFSRSHLNGTGLGGDLAEQAEAQQVNHCQGAGNGGTKDEFFKAGVVLLLFCFHNFEDRGLG